LTSSEKEIVKEKAARVGLSVSNYVKAVALGTPLPKFEQRESVLNLMKINSNLASLGNLFKLAIDNQEISSPRGEEIIKEIQATKQELRQLIENISKTRK
jgi:hypothetical protein